MVCQMKISCFITTLGIYWYKVLNGSIFCGVLINCSCGNWEAKMQNFSGLVRLGIGDSLTQPLTFYSSKNLSLRVGFICVRL